MRRRIFPSSLETLYSVHETFLEAVTAKQAEWNSESIIGDVFLELCPYFNLYPPYLAEFNQQMQTCREVKKNNDNFREFIERCFAVTLKDPTNDLNSLLITPVQRVPRYLMLLKNLLKNTAEDHADYPLLKRALDSVSTICDKIEKKTDDSENVTQMHRIQEMLVEGGGEKFETVIASHRRFVRDCDDVMLVYKDQTEAKKLFVFNDMLVLANVDSKNGKPAYSYHSRHYFQSMSISDDPFTTDYHCVYLQFQNKNENAVCLGFKTPELKSSFWELMEKSIAEVKSKAATIRKVIQHSHSGGFLSSDAETESPKMTRFASGVLERNHSEKPALSSSTSAVFRSMRPSSSPVVERKRDSLVIGRRGSNGNPPNSPNSILSPEEKRKQYSSNSTMFSPPLSPTSSRRASSVKNRTRSNSSSCPTSPSQSPREPLHFGAKGAKVLGIPFVGTHNSDGSISPTSKSPRESPKRSSGAESSSSLSISKKSGSDGWNDQIRPPTILSPEISRSEKTRTTKKMSDPGPSSNSASSSSNDLRKSFSSSEHRGKEEEEIPTEEIKSSSSKKLSVRKKKVKRKTSMNNNDAFHHTTTTVKALRDYEPENDHNGLILRFKRDESLTVVHRNKSGWFYAFCSKGNGGLVPCHFVDEPKSEQVEITLPPVPDLPQEDIEKSK